MLRLIDFPADGASEKILILLCGAGEDTDKILAGLTQDCAVAVVASDDWNADYSPWQADGFAGQGAAALHWLREKILAEYPGREYYLAGYSLAGLFALWAYYEESSFAGAACVSGSLWYPGWQEYVRPVRQSKGRVYLSLGGKEAKSGDPRIATVAQAFQAQYEECKKDNLITAVKYELNPGGHFSQVEKRIAKGINWLCGAGRHAD